MANGHGGKREGGGRPLGSKNEKTLQKAEAREHVRQFVTANLDPLLQAQLHNACGLSHLMMRDPETDRFERVTGGAKQIDRVIKSKNACWIYTKIRMFKPLRT